MVLTSLISMGGMESWCFTVQDKEGRVTMIVIIWEQERERIASSMRIFAMG